MGPGSGYRHQRVIHESSNVASGHTRIIDPQHCEVYEMTLTRWLLSAGATLDTTSSVLPHQHQFMHQLDATCVLQTAKSMLSWSWWAPPKVPWAQLMIYTDFAAGQPWVTALAAGHTLQLHTSELSPGRKAACTMLSAVMAACLLLAMIY